MFGRVDEAGGLTYEEIKRCCEYRFAFVVQQSTDTKHYSMVDRYIRYMPMVDPMKMMENSKKLQAQVKAGENPWADN